MLTYNNNSSYFCFDFNYSLRECEKISKEMSETDVEPEMTERLLKKINAEINREFKQCKKDMVSDFVCTG